MNYTEPRPGIAPEGLIALQIHGNCKAVIAFRNIAIEELPENAECSQRFGEPQGRTPLCRVSRGDSFVLDKDEVVVFAGQTNFVREQKAGELEARMAFG